jgi:hypothetical protein
MTGRHYTHVENTGKVAAQIITQIDSFVVVDFDAVAVGISRLDRRVLDTFGPCMCTLVHYNIELWLASGPTKAMKSKTLRQQCGTHNRGMQ